MANLEDRLEINELVASWIHRDLGHWDEVRDLFHPDSVIRIPWFEGLASDFVDAIARMGTESDLTSKHLIGFRRSSSTEIVRLLKPTCSWSA